MSGRSTLVGVAAAVALLAAGTTTASATASTEANAVQASPQVRVDELGYLPHEAKHARLMTAEPVSGARFEVVDAQGHAVMHGAVPPRPLGGWNQSYHAVYRLSFGGLRTPGSYRIRILGTVTATSPRFGVLGAGDLYGTLLRDGVLFDQVQRDGAHVLPGALHRRPSHLLDRSATVYEWPRMEAGSDLILDPDLTPLRGRAAGPVDVSGGWFDAGDYLKFTHSTAYNDVLLFTSARLLGRRAARPLTAEARHGLAWLEKMWNPSTRTLFMQVGIGSGNKAETFLGDHDKWRLPEADDTDHAALDRYVSHRPVFRAAPPGQPISPNLVGRVAASFALAAQLDARTHPHRAAAELRQARLVYSTADTASPPRPLVTALPHAFYPESSWRDDMELAAAEIALAAHTVGRDARPYVRAAAHWARGYIVHNDGADADTLNLYDTSALAHAALVRAMALTPSASRLKVTRSDLLRNLRAQILRGVRHARSDPFGAGVAYDDFDVNSHTFGLIATVGLYDDLTHSRRFEGFATAQRTWLLGGDPWGVGAMVGVGTHFPWCMQHQVANLSGSTDGSAPLDVGAVVNGPNGADNFEGGLGGFQDGMVRCSHDLRRLAAFDTPQSRYVDDVRSWQTDEPALDMSGAAIIAAASQLGLHPGARVSWRPAR